MPANDLKELIAWLKANPDRASQATSGLGGYSHLAGLFFQKQTGTRFQFVSYRGGAQSTQDLVAGQIDLMIDQASNALPQVRSGNIKAYAVASKSRLAEAPDIPTADEAGLPGYLVTTWYGVFAPAGTPAAIVNRLHADLVKAMQTPDVKAKLEGIGADGTVSRSPEEFAALVRADTTRYAKIVKDIGLKLD